MFTGKEDHGISLDQASKQTRRYRESRPKHGIKGGYFSRTAFEKILAQANCVGIRVYFGLHEDGTPTMVLAGVTEDGNDIDQGLLSDDHLPCPPYCGADNPLNS
ncbi:MAG: hypothetical protein L0Y80_08255 [Ignavibacteriae bacterium]|nr:hypothetical protein [Ignavibacteriota bacterium]